MKRVRRKKRHVRARFTAGVRNTWQGFVLAITILWGLVCGLLTILLVATAATIPDTDPTRRHYWIIENLLFLVGTLGFLVLMVWVPILDLLAPRIADKKTRPTRWMVAGENLHDYWLYACNFVVATFYFPHRNLVDVLIR